MLASSQHSAISNGALPMLFAFSASPSKLPRRYKIVTPKATPNWNLAEYVSAPVSSNRHGKNWVAQ